MKIGEVAELFNVSPAAVRDWEARGHLDSFRTPGGQRRFLRAQVEKLIPPAMEVVEPTKATG